MRRLGRLAFLAFVACAAQRMPPRAANAGAIEAGDVIVADGFE